MGAGPFSPGRRLSSGFEKSNADLCGESRPCPHPKDSSNGLFVRFLFHGVSLGLYNIFRNAFDLPENSDPGLWDCHHRRFGTLCQDSEKEGSANIGFGKGTALDVSRFDVFRVWGVSPGWLPAFGFQRNAAGNSGGFVRPLSAAPIMEC